MLLKSTSNFKKTNYYLIKSKYNLEKSIKNVMTSKIYNTSIKNKVTLNNMNENLIKSEYQVRGTVVIRSAEIQKKLSIGEGNYSFDKLTPLNIGNPQALKQLPLTFPREVIGCLFSNLSSNKDAINRADTYKKELSSIENYTHFTGMHFVRKNVAKFISWRDSVEDVDKKDIIITNGAGGGIRVVLESLINDNLDTVMVPIPQYPLYSALIQLMNCNLAGYYLDESNGWGLDLNNIEKVYKDNYDKGKRLKAFVIINPGNPTGNVLSKENIEELVKFCYENKMVILADEVYQNNIYAEDKKFYSTREIIAKMPYPYKRTTLFSFNSISKGYYGECGLRGGYMDMYNVPDIIKRCIYKIKSLEVCPNLIGQISLDLLVRPPLSRNCSEETVDLYNKEKNNNFNNLKSKAKILSEKLNSIPGFKCNNIDGAMYAFPSIDIPEFRIKEANKKGISPDLHYAMSLLEATGIISVPGSGFGQKENTHHIRLTNLVNPVEEMSLMLDRLKEFSLNYFDKKYNIEML